MASEILGKKCSIPEPEFGDSPLALHERGLFREAEGLLHDMGGYEQHRAAAFNKRILPICRSLVEAIGCRMAFEAAQRYKVSPLVVRLYELLSMSADLSWYVENGVTTRALFAESLTIAYDTALPVFLALEDANKETAFITAPIMTEKAWSTFINGLPRFESLKNGSACSSKL